MQSSEKKLKVINLYGAPGVGKSATRSGVFWLMKVKGMSVEEVSEYAKYLVLANRTWQLKEDQLYIVAKQHHKMLILNGQYEYAITDSPLLLASYYGRLTSAPASFHTMCEEYDQRFENISFFLKRDFSKAATAFETTGRVHSQEEAQTIEHEQKAFLESKGIHCIDVLLDHQSPWTILKHLESLYPGSVPKGGPLPPMLEIADA